MKESIKEWLQKTGYPLELYVQQQLVKNGYTCNKSPIYVDLENEASRELDIVAYNYPSDGDASCTFQPMLYIECKKSEKPLVVLTASTDKTDRYRTLFNHEICGGNMPPFGIVTLAHLLDLSQNERDLSLGKFSEKCLTGYSIVPSFSKSDENIYKGVMGLCKANDYFRKQYLDFYQSLKEDKKDDPDTLLHYELQIPILLVDCQLFNAYLDDAGEITIDECQWANLRVKLPWLANSYESERECSIQVVTKNYFSTFLKELDKLTFYISQQERLNDISKYEG